MDEAEQLSVLIGKVYDAVLDASLWPDALIKTRQFVGGGCASLFIKEPSAKDGILLYQCGGISQYYADRYWEKYVRIDPVSIGQFLTEIGVPFCTTDLIPYDELLNTPSFVEWSRPQGWVDFVGVVLDKSHTRAALLGVFRHERDGMTDDEARQRMRLLAPHFRRAVLIAKIIEMKTAEAASLADTLDGLNAAMFLADRNARIVHANAAGLAALSEGRIARSVSGKLALVDAAADRLLNDAIMNAESGDAALGAKGIAVAFDAPDSKKYVAHLLPLTSGARRQAGEAYSAVALVFIRRATLDRPHPIEAIAKAYRLTPTEMRVLMMIVEIGGVPEVAPVLGISETTVKTHLQRIFSKTATRRQADLVKLVAGVMGPFMGDTVS
jgi:DNA-binding CsgD family transcriptional regulator